MTDPNACKHEPDEVITSSYPSEGFFPLHPSRALS